MESPEHRNGRREDSPEAREEEEEEMESDEKKKQKSNRNRKSSTEDVEAYDDTARRRGESRKRSSSHAHSEEDEYETKRDSRSRRKLEESSSEKLSSWYHDGDSEKTRSKSSSKNKYDDVERKEKAHRSSSRRRWEESDNSATDSKRSDSERGKNKDDSRQRRSSSVRDENDRSHGRRSKDGESSHHRSREYARENDRSLHGRSRGDSAKASSNYSNDDYDVIEIQTKPVDGKPLPKGMGRGRGRGVRETQQPMGLQLPIMGSPYGPMGPMPPMNLSTPTPMTPNVFIPPFSPIVWPGARVDMNMMRFPPSGSTFFNVRGIPPLVRGPFPDRPWLPPRAMGPLGKAPSRGEQNDYSQNFVDTGMRPQNFIRELELTNVVEDYPKLRELIQKKDEIVSKSATAPMYLNCDLKTFDLSPEFFGSKFDVILIDPPWEEYAQRAAGVAEHLENWTFEEILNLKIEAIADTPSFIFLWVGDCVGLEQGRQCLKKWGFRRCEDICWVKTNKANATPGIRHDSHTLFQHSKEHCLMGIKGTVRRSTDGHIIHANIDTDVIIAEEPPYGSTRKPEDMYRIIEHFALGRRRLELFGEEHNIRAGWVTLGKDLSSSNFNAESYVKNFSDKDGKVWQGGSGRNPPPEAPHLVITTPDIEALRPKSPMKNLPAPLVVTAVKSVIGSSSNPSTPVSWSLPIDTSRPISAVDDSHAVIPSLSDLPIADSLTQT